MTTTVTMETVTLSLARISDCSLVCAQTPFEKIEIFPKGVWARDYSDCRVTHDNTSPYPIL